MQDKMTDESLMPAWSKYKGQKLANVPASYLLWLYYDWGLKDGPNSPQHQQLKEYIEDNMDALKAETKK